MLFRSKFANAAKPLQNAIRSATGINQPDEPQAAPKSTPAPVSKPAAAPKSAPASVAKPAAAPKANETPFKGRLIPRSEWDSNPSSTSKTAPAVTKQLAGKELQSTISNIAKTNKIADPNKIYAGKTIDLGGGDKYTVKQGDNLTKIARGFYGGGKVSEKPTTPEPAKTSSTPSADDVKRQYGTSAELQRDTAQAAGPKTAPSVRPQAPETPAPIPSMAPQATSSSKEGEQKMKAMTSLKEEVQVGENKYRIV